MDDPGWGVDADRFGNAVVRRREEGDDDASSMSDDIEYEPRVQVRVSAFDPLKNLAGITAAAADQPPDDETSHSSSSDSDDKGNDDNNNNGDNSVPSGDALTQNTSSAGQSSGSNSTDKLLLPLGADETDRLLSRLVSRKERQGGGGESGHVDNNRADDGDDDGDDNGGSREDGGKPRWPPRELDAGKKLMRDKSLKPPLGPGAERTVAFPPAQDRGENKSFGEEVEARLAARKRVAGQGEEGATTTETTADGNGGGKGGEQGSTTAAKPLRVTWSSPGDGSEKMRGVQEVTVYFSDDVVPLAEVDALSWDTDRKKPRGDTRKYFVASLSPCPAGGRWRWISTDELRFDLGDVEGVSLPGSTRYTLTVAAGLETTTAAGEPAKLVEGYSATFSTAPAKLLKWNCGPLYNTDELDPVFTLAFDQLVDQRATLAGVRVSRMLGLLGAGTPRLTKASGKPLSADPPKPSREVFFKLDGPLAPNSTIRVNVSDIVSAEGPLRSSKSYQYRFDTRRPMTISYHEPSYKIYPTDAVECSIAFENPIDLEKTPQVEDCLTVRPQPREFDDLKMKGNCITWRQSAEAGMAYTISTHGVVDIFGQPLAGWRKTRQIRVRHHDSYDASGTPHQTLRHGDYFDWDNFIVLDPHAARKEGARFSFVSSQYKELRVCLYRMPGPSAGSLYPSTYEKVEDRKKCPLDVSVWGKHRIIDRVFSLAELRAMTAAKHSLSAKDAGAGEEGGDGGEGEPRPDAEVGEEELDLDLGELIRMSEAGVAASKKKSGKKSTSGKAEADDDSSGELVAAAAPPGYYFLYVEPTKNSIKNRPLNPFASSWWTYRPTLHASLLVTELGVHTCATPAGLCVLVVDLITGKPAKTVNIWAFQGGIEDDDVLPRDQSRYEQYVVSDDGKGKRGKSSKAASKSDAERCFLGSTDVNGCVVLAPHVLQAAEAFHSSRRSDRSYHWYDLKLVAQRNTDCVTFSPTFAAAAPNSTLWYVFDDRRLYKPNETVHIKGFVRALENRAEPAESFSADGDNGKKTRKAAIAVLDSSDQKRRHPSLTPAPEAMGMAVTVPAEIAASRGKLFVKVFDPWGDCIVGNDKPFEVPVSATFGSFDFSFDLPDSTNLGDARIEFKLKSRKSGTETFSHYFSVQEFRTPEYKSTVEVDSDPVAEPFFATPLPRAELLENLARQFDGETETRAFPFAKKVLDDEVLDDVVADAEGTATAGELDGNQPTPMEEAKPNFAVVSAKASYYAGGALSGARAQWNVQHGPVLFSPPGTAWEAFSFSTKSFTLGEGSDDYYDNSYFGRFAGFGRRGRSSATGSEGRKWRLKYGYNDGWEDSSGSDDDDSKRTDAAGVHKLMVEWQSSYWPPRPVSFTTEATIVDSNNQSTVASTSFMVHPAKYYCGVNVGVPDDDDRGTSRNSGKIPRGGGKKRRGRARRPVVRDWNRANESKPRPGEVIPVTFCVVSETGEPVPGALVDVRIVGAGKNPTLHKHESVNDLVSLTTNEKDTKEQVEVLALDSSEDESASEDENNKDDSGYDAESGPTPITHDDVMKKNDADSADGGDTEANTKRRMRLVPTTVKRGCVLFQFRPRTSGSYTLSGLVVDDLGRCHVTQASFYVEDVIDDAAQARMTKEKQDKVVSKMAFAAEGQVALTLDRENSSDNPYEPGEECVLSVAPPEVPCQLSLFATAGSDTHRVHMRIREGDLLPDGTPGKQVKMQLFDEFLPSVQVHCIATAISRTRRGTKTAAPSVATGDVSIPVAKKAHEVTCELQLSSAQVMPGEKVDLTAVLKTQADSSSPFTVATDQTRTGEVLVFAVDSAVLDLGGFVPPDPLSSMVYDGSGGGTQFSSTHYSRILLRDLAYLRDKKEEVSSSEDDGGSGSLSSSSSSGSSDDDDDFRGGGRRSSRAQGRRADAFELNEECKVEGGLRELSKASAFQSKSRSLMPSAPAPKKMAKEKSKKSAGGKQRKRGAKMDNMVAPTSSASLARGAFADDMDGDWGGAAPGGGGGGGGGGDDGGGAIVTRSDFNPLAFFGTKEFTWEEGGAAGAGGDPETSTATVDFSFPTRDSLTTYKIFAVAASAARIEVREHAAQPFFAPVGEAGSSEKKEPVQEAAAASTASAIFGTGEAQLVCALPLMVRTTCPRFFNFGDQRVSVDITLQNQTDNDLEDVNVAARVAGAEFVLSDNAGVEAVATTSDKQGVKLRIAARARAHVTLFVNPLAPPNEVVLEAAVSCGKFSDAVTVRAPVYLPGTAEAFATTGTMDGDGDALILPVLPPADAHLDVGSLDITCYSTAVNSLTDAMVYLYHYDFECNEQIASKLIGMLALRDVVYAFNGKPDAAGGKAEASSEEDIGGADAPAVSPPAEWCKPELPDRVLFNVMVGADVARLSDRQHSNGSWGFWGEKGERDNIFLTVHIAHTLALLRLKGYSVPKSCWDAAFDYLWHIKRHLLLKRILWSRSSVLAAESLSIYVVHKMMRASEMEPTDSHWKDLRSWAQSFYKSNKKKLDVEAVAWSLQVLGALSDLDQDGIDGSADNKRSKKKDKKFDATRKEIREFFLGQVHSTSDTATFNVGGADLGDSDAELVILRSDIRVDAAVLEALIVTDPKNKLIPKLARGISMRRKIRRAGRFCCSAWGNTQDNAWVLLALDAYFSAYERDDPDFLAKVWFGGEFAGAVEFKGRTCDRFTVPIPMKHVTETLALNSSDKVVLPDDAPAGDKAVQQALDALVLMKDGEPGRLYYRISLSYAPSGLDFDARNLGMQVRRSYEALDSPGDVALAVDCHDLVLDRTREGKKQKVLRAKAGIPLGPRRRWRVKLGARVRVTLTLTNSFDNYHVALVDRLPAGFEPLNPALAASTGMDHSAEAQGSSISTTDWWGYSRWFEHQNLRDERCEAFTELLWPGVHTFQFVCRATSMGVFFAPPATAEEMYSPDVMGRSATEFVEIYQA